MEHEPVNGTQPEKPEPEKPELDNEEEEHEQALEKHTPEEECRTELVSPTAWSMLSASPPPAELGHCFDVDAGYDPNRIPASVFDAPTTPSGWSATSNESLFSIHMGNNSFSRDHHAKSGELKRLDDWQEDNAKNEAITNSGVLPTVVEEGSIASGMVSRVGSFDSRMSKASPAREVLVSDPITRSGSSSNARISEESANSARSFAFPVLVGDANLNLKKTTSVGEVADIPEEPHLEEKVSAIDNKSSDPKKKNKRSCCSRFKLRFSSKFCCWCRRHS